MSDRGFTLLEVLVALAMIAIVMVSVMRLQGQSISMNKTARFYSVAPFLAQSKMAEVKFDPFAFTGGGDGNFEDAFAGYTWTVRIEEKELSLEGKTPVALQAAAVTVSLASAGLKYTLSGYIHDVTGEQF